MGIDLSLSFFCKLSQTAQVANKIVIILITIWTSTLYAGNFAMRAREHFDLSKMELAGSRSDYSGFNNTINFWYEEPTDYAFGLAVGPVLGKLTPHDSPPLFQVDSELTMYWVGVEYKQYFAKFYGDLFVRLGGYWNSVDLGTTYGTKTGWSYLGSIGWEREIFKGLVISPEFSLKQGDTQGLYFLTYSMAIGFHFKNFSLF